MDNIEGSALDIYGSYFILIVLFSIGLLPWFLEKVSGIIGCVWELFSKTDFVLRTKKYLHTFQLSFVSKRDF